MTAAVMIPPRRLERIQVESPQVSVIHLSRNFGHQAAVSAGWNTPEAGPSS